MISTAVNVGTKLVMNKWFWIIVATIIILLLVRKNWNKISGKFQRNFGDYSSDEVTKLTPDVKRKVESLCETLMQEINTTCTSQIWGVSCVKEDTLKQLNALDDNELEYAAKYYKKALSRGNSMYSDVDDESLYDTDQDEKLLLELAKIGQKV